jgi:DNA-binding NtrC family response regulator
MPKPNPDSFYAQRVEACRVNVVCEALQACHGNVTRAARYLGVMRSVVTRLIRVHAIDVKLFRR